MPDSPDGTEQHRVLVVDDEPNIVDVVSMALRFQGFAVESASSGREALAAVRTFDPHLTVAVQRSPLRPVIDVTARPLTRAPSAVKLPVTCWRSVRRSSKPGAGGRSR